MGKLSDFECFYSIYFCLDVECLFGHKWKKFLEVMFKVFWSIFQNFWYKVLKNDNQIFAMKCVKLCINTQLGYILIWELTFWENVNPHHVSHVMCHVSGVRCQVSCVNCPFFDKDVELVGGGSVINRAYPVKFMS